jgi:regulatory protein
VDYRQKQALLKMEKYCAYQERCYSEAEEKLRHLGLYGNDAGEVLIELSQKGFLDEERFAGSFCRGKHRLKKWGRLKIIRELKLRRVSEYCIKSGLKEIDRNEYRNNLQELAEKKWNLLSGEKSHLIRYKKTGSYLFAKGYEPDLIKDILEELLSQI